MMPTYIQYSTKVNALQYWLLQHYAFSYGIIWWSGPKAQKQPERYVYLTISNEENGDWRLYHKEEGSYDKGDIVSNSEFMKQTRLHGRRSD